MTIAATVERLARGEIGTLELPPGSNRTKYGQWYGMDGVAWCAIFVSYIFWSAGLPLPAQSRKGFSGCEIGLQWFRQMGAFVKTGRGGFRVGDVPFYQFDKDVPADHTGIIVGLKPKSIIAVEGNTSAGSKGSQTNGDGVFLRERPLSLIIGVGRPLYSAQAPALTPAPSTKPTWPGRFLTITSPHTRGADVKTLQRRLNTFGGPQLAVDGDFGMATFDRVRWWQAAHALEVDGVVGRETWAAFFR